jgi:Pyruvate phosphate dikinase, AMP/ATP-binding domain
MLPTEKNRLSSRFKLFHELMQIKVQRILLIGTSYEAWILEEDCRISEQIVNEYRGLNLSRPPRLTWVSSLDEALELYPAFEFDLVITFSQTVDAHAFELGLSVKEVRPGIPVVLLTHQETLPDASPAWHELSGCVDLVVYWSGQADILLAIVKSIEDRLNVEADTATAGVRVILVVEDSPYFLSLMLPILYKELVAEVQAVIEEGLNEEHRLLTMRTRPKILLAHSYEKALSLYEKYKPYVLGVISDMRYPREQRLDPCAGLQLLRHIKADRFDIPLLLTSSESANGRYAGQIPALFLDKNTPSLREGVKIFLVEHLGYGDFIFRMPDGSAIGKAGNLYALEKMLVLIPQECFLLHSRHNDFSRWFYTLAEVELASRVRALRDSGFDTVEEHRRNLIDIIREKRIARQRGVIVNFDRDRFDPDTNFAKIGNGSLGGKARGLAFFSALLHRHGETLAPFIDRLDIVVPQTLVLTTSAFDEFISAHDLQHLAGEDLDDQQVLTAIEGALFPSQLRQHLSDFLEQATYPLAVRSSSLLEDAQFKSYAGLYDTSMLANDHPDPQQRLLQLENAIRRVYASTYFKAPKAFSRRVGNQIEQEKMAVVIQEVVGCRHGEYFYPAISGVAQSLNYYPFAAMRPEDGVVSIAVGLGRAVMEGEKILRFSPRHPEILPQRGTMRNILDHAQQHFYALAMNRSFQGHEDETIERREVASAVDDPSLRFLLSSYDPAEQRIRDCYDPHCVPLPTFAAILKYKAYPLAQAINLLLDLGKKGLGCPVEIEFAVDLARAPEGKARLAVLQVRPMSAREEMLEVAIDQEERDRAFCLCHQALGNTDNRTMCDLVYVKPESFNPAKTRDIARELGLLNGALLKEGRKYILVGPGRWGSADPWLGVPVTWNEICGVGAIVETTHPAINADPSQGSHFFHNITSLGINYLNVGVDPGDRFLWENLLSLEVIAETPMAAHLRAAAPFVLRVDGRSRLGVISLSAAAPSPCPRPARPPVLLPAAPLEPGTASRKHS